MLQYIHFTEILYIFSFFFIEQSFNTAFYFQLYDLIFSWISIFSLKNFILTQFAFSFMFFDIHISTQIYIPIK